MTFQITPGLPGDRRVIFEIRGGPSDGAVFDSRDVDPASGAMAGHLWFASAGGVGGETFDGRSIADADRAARSATGRADEPYASAQSGRFAVVRRVDDGAAIRIAVRDVTAAAKSTDDPNELRALAAEAEGLSHDRS